MYDGEESFPRGTRDFRSSSRHFAAIHITRDRVTCFVAAAAAAEQAAGR